MQSNQAGSIVPGKAFSRSGISLIELGLVMVIISLALVPVVQMINGPQTAEGGIERVSRLKSREAVLANAMVEKVLSGDYSNFDCLPNGTPNPSFNEATDFPAGGQSKTFGLCQSTNYNEPLYYQWTVLNLNDAATNGFAMPVNNDYYQATFNVRDEDGNVLLTLPTYFFRNSGAFSTDEESIGVMLAMDISGSMAWSCGAGGATCTPGTAEGISSPWMFYRYDASRFTGTWGVGAWGISFSPAGIPATPNRIVLDPADNSQLDLFFGREIDSVAGLSPGEDPDSATLYNEAFPYFDSSINHAVFGDGLLGTGDCTSASVSDWRDDPNLRHTFLPDARQNNAARARIRSLCSAKTDINAWSDTINENLSRIEAARTAALTLLLNLESKPTVVSNIEMGFIPWNNTTHPSQAVAMEPATMVGSQYRFQNMRNRLLWINRADPQSRHSSLPIKAINGTYIYGGLDYARNALLNKNYDRRIIVLLSDGQPDPATGNNSKANLRSYALNTLGNNAPGNEQITLFTVGLIAADNALMTDMANSTPDGQAYIADDIQSLSPIFESISYQIQKLALMSTAERYGIYF